MTKVHENIRKIRELKGYSQENLAHRLEMSQSAYAKYEKESSNITLRRLEQIAQELEVSLTELLSLDKSTVYNFSNNQISTVSNIIENLHTENIETLNIFINFLKDENNSLKDRIKFLEEKLDSLK